MYLRLFILVWCVLVTAVAPAFADEARLSLDQSIDFQSNAFNSAVAPVKDGVYQVIPRLEVEGETPSLTYYAEYEPRATIYFKTNGINGVDHYFDGRSTFKASPKDAFTLTARVANWRAIRSTTFDNPADNLAPENIFDARGTVLRIFADLTYQHNFSPRSFTRAGMSYQDFSYTDSFNQDNRSLSGLLEYIYVVSSRLSLGLDLIGRYRQFEDGTLFGLFPYKGSETGILNANLLFVWAITPTIRLQGSGGPSVFVLRQPDFTVIPIGQLQSEEVKYFGAATLSKDLRRGKITANWLRNEDASSGVGSSTLLNQVNVVAWWDTDQYWRLRGLVGWRNRQLESISRVTGNISSRRELSEVWVDTSVIRTINERVDVRLRFRYQQRIKDVVDAVVRPESQNFTVGLTLRYEFEPYRY